MSLSRDTVQAIVLPNAVDGPINGNLHTQPNCLSDICSHRVCEPPKKLFIARSQIQYMAVERRCRGFAGIIPTSQFYVLPTMFTPIFRYGVDNVLTFETVITDKFTVISKRQAYTSKSRERASYLHHWG
jgi:hypothetical protein